MYTYLQEEFVRLLNEEEPGSGSGAGGALRSAADGPAGGGYATAITAQDKEAIERVSTENSFKA
jgi:hypothetical protein